MCEVFNLTLPCLSFQVTMDSEKERNRPRNSYARLSNLQMRALNDSMSNLLNTGLEAIHQRLDELQGRPTQSRTRTRRYHPRRNSRSDLEIREESYDNDRSSTVQGDFLGIKTEVMSILLVEMKEPMMACV